jgi:hypothetical protein
MPLSTPNSLAGLMESSSTILFRSMIPLLTSSKAIGNAVCRPIIPGMALSNRPFSFLACGAWSVAMQSMVRSFMPSKRACISSSLLKGGLTLALAPLFKTAHPLQRADGKG